MVVQHMWVGPVQCTQRIVKREGAQERMALSHVLARTSSSHQEEKDRCGVGFGWWHKKTQRMETRVSDIQGCGKCVTKPDRFPDEIHILVLHSVLEEGGSEKVTFLKQLLHFFGPSDGGEW